ncbi:MAG: hypothetical protein AB1711_08715 [Thermodesulfobacteriota bacterium]
MPSPITKPAEVGFAEFTGQLITETFQAVVRSLVQQEKEVRDMEQIAALEPADFARLYITEDMLRAEIICLFPSKEGKETESSIDPGSPYTLQDEKQAEDPPVFILTGYRITGKDLEKDRETGNLKISKVGYAHIKEIIQSMLAASYRDTLLLMFQKGIPRVMIDHGKINTKLSFYLTNVMEKGEETKSKLPAAFISKLSLPRLTVKPVSNRTPEFLTLKVDVIGEVEITFKTVTI